MTKTKCSTPKCKTEGGKFHFNGGKWVCHFCYTGGGVRNRVGAMFPYTTSHILGPNYAPVEVNSLHHLRKLERQFGVNSEVFNRDSSNIAPYTGK